MQNLLKAFIYEEEAASAMEYALLGVGIAVAIVTAVYTLGNTLTNMFNSINTKLQ